MTDLSFSLFMMNAIDMTNRIAFCDDLHYLPSGWKSRLRHRISNLVLTTHNCLDAAHLVQKRLPPGDCQLCVPPSAVSLMGSLCSLILPFLTLCTPPGGKLFSYFRALFFSFCHVSWHHTPCHKHVSEYDNDVKTHRCIRQSSSAIAHVISLTRDDDRTNCGVTGRIGPVLTHWQHC